MPTPPANAWAASAPANTGVDTGLDTARPVLDFGAHIPFVQMLGLVLHRMQDGQSELSYALQPQHTNSFGITHGGVSMTLLDVVMADPDAEPPGAVLQVPGPKRRQRV